MPYIEHTRREGIEYFIGSLVEEISSLGELNFAITCLIKAYWHREKSYSQIAGLVGVLENVKQEFYRRVAEPYEDEKIKLNGDVY